MLTYHQNTHRWQQKIQHDRIQVGLSACCVFLPHKILFRNELYADIKKKKREQKRMVKKKREKRKSSKRKKEKKERE